MVEVIRANKRPIWFAVSFWAIFWAIFYATFYPWAVEREKARLEEAFTIESLVTNNRQDGPPKINITSGPLVLGDPDRPSTGSPRVHPDWLVKKTFEDVRTVLIYHDNALGAPACPPMHLNRADEPFTDRAGGVQPEAGYSLSHWTNFRLRPNPHKDIPGCLLEPGWYVVETVYRVPVSADVYLLGFKVGRHSWYVTMSFTSNRFEITP